MMILYIKLRCVALPEHRIMSSYHHENLTSLTLLLNFSRLTNVSNEHGFYSYAYINLVKKLLTLDAMRRIIIVSRK